MTIKVDLEKNTLHVGVMPPLPLAAGLAELAHALVASMPGYSSAAELRAALYGRKPQTGFRMAVMRLRRAIKGAGIEIIYNPDNGYCMRRVLL